MNTHYGIVILLRRKNAGVYKDQQYYSGKKYINNEVRLIPEP
jgi:hypothetical protein